MAPKLYVFQLSPPCRAVLMVAKAIGLDLDVETVEREHLKTEEMLELNPLHTVPILVDSDEDFTIWDSHAINIYLVSQYGSDDPSLYPKDDAKKAAIINQRLQFDNILFEKCKAAFAPVMMGLQDEVSEDARVVVLELLGYIEIFLKDSQYVAGDDLTIADLSLTPIISTIEAVVVGIDRERFPKLADWLDRVKQLPYYDECNVEALEKFKEMMKLDIPIV